MRRISVALVSGGLGLVLSPRGLSHGQHADALDDVIRSELTRQGIPGAAGAVIRGKDVLKARGYGLVNLEHHDSGD